MSSKLQKQLQKIIDEKNVSILSIEKKIGLGANSVRNIIQGKSKNPSFKTVTAIAEALGFDVNELLSDESTSSSSTESAKSFPEITIDTPEQRALFKETLIFAINMVVSYNRPINGPDFFRTMIDIYNYSLNKNNMSLDVKFAEWIIEDRFKS